MPRVAAVSLSADGKYLATADDDSTIRIWEANSKQEIATMRHAHGVAALAFNSDGTYLATVGWDTTVAVWKVASCRRPNCQPLARTVQIGRASCRERGE